MVTCVDINLAKPFICTRVCSTNEDWIQRIRLLQYLQGTIDMTIVIGMNGIDLMETYVDVVYAVHHGMRRYTWELVTLRRGMI